MPIHIPHHDRPYCGTPGDEPTSEDFDDVDCRDCIDLFHLSLSDWERSLLGPHAPN